MNHEQAAEQIKAGSAVLGIEFGSTRIKAILIGSDHTPIASGDYDWENRYEGGYWTYSMEEIMKGLTGCYQSLKQDVKQTYGLTLKTMKAMGFSGMMHGYLAFDQGGKLLVPFRTWRNTTAGRAAGRLTEVLQYNIPERWSIAHLYQAILDQEPHVSKLSYMTTLSGYIHWILTGEKVLGVGDASGMFPIDPATGTYDAELCSRFEKLEEVGQQLSGSLTSVLPKVLKAGEAAGCLTAEGARILDPEGDLEAGIPMCPPEGDAGTGMMATNSVAKRTGNVSAGTSVFAMIVLEHALSKVYPQIDLVTTPAGDLVAMVHANNCTSDINAWAGLFGEFAEKMGMQVDKNRLFTMLYQIAMEGEKDCGGLLSYGYLSGEFITGMEEGRPLFVRMPDAHFTLANFMRTHLLSSLGALRIGMEILTKEQVQVDEMFGHGGFFKTKGTGQNLMAAAMETDISVMETAGEGGAFGMALLAAYSAADGSEPLETWLRDTVFAGMEKQTVSPDPEDVKGFAAFMEHYKSGLSIERAAVESFVPERIEL